MAAAVYLLCLVTSAACAALLVRGFLRTREPLLGWSAVCFVGLALNNLGVVYDLIVVPDVDLSLLRKVPALIGVAALLVGLIWEKR